MLLPDWVIIADVASLARRLIDRVSVLANRAITDGRRWTLAIPGGSVAEAFLPRLAGTNLRWDSAHCFWCDERVVTLRDPRSNAGRADALWRADQQFGAPTVHPMPAAEPDLDSAAVAYAGELRRRTGNPPVLDVVLLGVGEDGHVASLFSGHTSLAVQESTVLVERAAHKPPPTRLSPALPVLCAARLSCLAAFGQAKQRVIQQALAEPTRERPVARVLRTAHHPLLLLDEAVALCPRPGSRNAAASHRC